MAIVPESVQNIVRTGENAGYHHFLMFPLSFPKAVFTWVLKLDNCVGKSQPFPKPALVCTYEQYKSFENTVGKGEIALNEQYILFP